MIAINKTWKRTAATVLLALFVATAAYASGDAAPAGEHHTPSPLDFSFIASVINFLIFAGLLYKFGAGPIKKMFIDRAQQIQDAVDALSAEKRAVESELARFEERVTAFDSEKKEYLAGVELAAQEEATRIIADADRHAKHLISDAEKRASALQVDVHNKMMAHFVDEIVDSVEERLRGKIDVAHDKELISKTIEGVQLT